MKKRLRKKITKRTQPHYKGVRQFCKIAAQAMADLSLVCLRIGRFVNNNMASIEGVNKRIISRPKERP